MILDTPTPDLDIFGVYDRSIPNRERIVIRVNHPANLAEYFLVLGVRGPVGADLIVPIPDQSLWLGATFVQVPSWIFVYTGSGKTGISQEKHTGEPVHTLYWNKEQVALIHDDVVPALIRVATVQIGNKPNKSLEDVGKPQDGDLAIMLKRLLARPTETKPS
jgi:hypothetical protein